MAYALIEKGFQVLGIDGSENMLEEARRRNAEHIASGRTEFIKADVRDLALNRTFGVATSLGWLIHRKRFINPILLAMEAEAVGS